MFFNVYNTLGTGLNEYCYQEGLRIELELNNIPFIKEYKFTPTYKGHEKQTSFRLDFLCKNKIIVECKAVDKLLTLHRAQLFNYMRLTNFPCVILVNFYDTEIKIERYFYDKNTNKIYDVKGNELFIFHQYWA